MQIELYKKARSTLAAFAEEHGLVMEVHERSPHDMGKHWTESIRYYARFKGCEVKSGNVLIGMYGNGCTPESAMKVYAQEISERRLVIDAMTEFRREIDVPLLVQE